MPNFTTEDLLVYLYDEMDAENACELETALQSDWALQQKFDVLKEAQQHLNEIPVVSPRLATVASILGYAEASLHISN